MYFAANSKYMIMGSRFIVGELVSSSTFPLLYLVNMYCCQGWGLEQVQHYLLS